MHTYNCCQVFWNEWPFFGNGLIFCLVNVKDHICMFVLKKTLKLASKFLSRIEFSISTLDWINLSLTDKPSIKCVIKKNFFVFQFNEKWQSCSYLCVLKPQQVSLNLNKNQKSFFNDTFNGWSIG